MKKILLLLVIASTSVTISHAQDANAKKILDNMSAKLKSSKGLSALFSYTTKDKKNINRGTVTGKIDLKGQKYYIKQGATEIFCNGAKTWNYNGDNNEVTVSPVDNDNSTLSPQKLLGDDTYTKDFSYKLVSSNGQYHQIRLIPNDKRKNFKQVTLFIDKTKNLVSKAQVIDKSDNNIEFKLSNVNTNATLADSKFEFSTASHPGVDVITN